MLALGTLNNLKKKIDNFQGVHAFFQRFDGPDFLIWKKSILSYIPGTYLIM